MKTPGYVKLISSVETNKKSVIELNIFPGEKTPWHYHNLFSESFTVLKGTLVVGKGKEVLHLNQGDIVIKNLAPGAVKSKFTKSTSFISNPDYDDYANKVQANMVASYQQAPGAETVAKVAFKAATDRKSRLRYPATMQAKMGFFLRWLLPLHVFNKMIAAPLEKKIDK